MYQCVYCKASYEHDQSYQHNAYECPKVRRKLKASLIGLLALCMVGLTGCEALKALLPQDQYPVGVERAELQLYKGGQVYKYLCAINVETKALTDCQEIK